MKERPLGSAKFKPGSGLSFKSEDGRFAMQIWVLTFDYLRDLTL